MNFKKLFSAPYQIAHELHKLLYKLKILRAQKINSKVISIGNFSFGGTGKTPFTIELAKYLIKQNYKVAILSRGYKRQSKSIVVTKSTENKFGIDDLGDEVTEMLENFQANSIEVSFGVYHDRYSAAQKILEQEQIDIFILDDGKQHLKLEKDFDLTLINASETGFYREFDWNSDHCIKIYTKVDEAWQKQNPEKFSIRFNLSLNKILDTTKVVGVFTGIADHKSLIKMIKNLIQEKYPGLINKPLTEWVFPDHHFFDLDEVTEVSSLGINLITTRKDLARIPKGFHDKFIVADLSLETNPENLFDRILG